MNNNFLDKKTYLDVIKATTLTAVDLIIVYNNSILMGYRKNNPAKDYWFVPGSRTRKNEKIMDGLQRMVKSELNLEINLDKVKLLGVYDHIYDNNYNDDTFGTHYVVSAFIYILNEKPKIKIDDQHEEIKWFPINQIKGNKYIHQYTKNYLINVLEHLK
tara:strand:+ start:48 stop:524 length:477 start_codon:yes stop_codon:yes gene_type:complete